MTTPPIARLLGAAATAVALCVAAPVVAQTQPPAQQQQPAQVSDHELKSFAEATLEVQRIGEDWKPRIAAAPDDQTGQQMRQQAQSEMVKAVEAKGLTVEKYQEIYQIAQLDPSVRQRLMAMIDEAK